MVGRKVKSGCLNLDVCGLYLGERQFTDTPTNLAMPTLWLTLVTFFASAIRKTNDESDVWRS